MSLLTSIVAYWKFDENTGSTVGDATGSGETGTWQGTLGSQWTTGRINSGGNFNGTNNFVKVPHGALNAISGSMTLAVWVKNSMSTGASDAIVLSSWDSSLGAQVYLKTSSTQHAALWDNHGLELAGTTNVCDGAWHHIVAVWDGTNAVLYVDGASQATHASTGPSASAYDFQIGCEASGSGSSSPSNFYAGTIDEVAVWSRALSSGEVTELYTAGQYPFYDNVSVLFEWSATVTTTVPVSTVTTDDHDQWSIPLEWSFLVSTNPPNDTSVPMVQIDQALITMPTPTLVNGKPDNTWKPSRSTGTWAKSLQLIINGADCSIQRSRRFVPVSDTDREPFGDGEASFAFPGITEFDDPSSFGLVQFATVTYRRLDASDVWHTEYEGEIASLEPDQLDGLGVRITCVGVINRLNLLKEAPALNEVAVEAGNLIAHRFNDKRRRFNLNIRAMEVVNTGILATPGGPFQSFIDFIQDKLAALTTDSGNQYTVALDRPRTPVLRLKDLTTVHATVSYGAPGVQVQLSKDFTTATTAVYATGTNGHCAWMGARFPNIAPTTAFPLATGHTFVAGDGQTGFAPFAAFLRRGQYGTIESDDTYLASDVDSVEQFQDRAGLTTDGIVGSQTWTAAFASGHNQDSVTGAYVDTISEKPQTRKYLYNAQGAQTGPNPSFNPAVPRIEEYIPFGDGVSKKLGRTSARQTIDRAYPAGRQGTIVLASDPAEKSRFAIRAGENIKVTNYAGGYVLVHVVERVRDWRTKTVTLTVDEKAHDALTAAGIFSRNREVADLTRRRTPGRRRAKQFNDYGQWLCEDGAGYGPIMSQQAGLWNVQRVAAAPSGTLERISYAAGTGLTEHVLNQVLSDNPPATVSGAARFAIGIFARPVNPNTLANLPGLSTPLTDMADGTNPWDYNNKQLTQTHGMIYSAGGPGQACGFYPVNDPGDGTDTGLSGILEDGGSVTFGPTGYYWLWVAIWSPVSCKAGGRLFPGAPN